MLTSMSSKSIYNYILIPTDINECASNGGHGPCDQYCTNTNGSFYCSCQSGFTQSGYMCNGKVVFFGRSLELDDV